MFSAQYETAFASTAGAVGGFAQELVDELHSMAKMQTESGVSPRVSASCSVSISPNPWEEPLGVGFARAWIESVWDDQSQRCIHGDWLNGLGSNAAALSQVFTLMHASMRIQRGFRDVGWSGFDGSA